MTPTKRICLLVTLALASGCDPVPDLDAGPPEAGTDAGVDGGFDGGVDGGPLVEDPDALFSAHYRRGEIVVRRADLGVVHELARLGPSSTFEEVPGADPAPTGEQLVVFNRAAPIPAVDRIWLISLLDGSETELRWPADPGACALAGSRVKGFWLDDDEDRYLLACDPPDGSGGFVVADRTTLVLGLDGSMTVYPLRSACHIEDVAPWRGLVLARCDDTVELLGWDGAARASITPVPIDAEGLTIVGPDSVAGWFSSPEGPRVARWTAGMPRQDGVLVPPTMVPDGRPDASLRFSPDGALASQSAFKGPGADLVRIFDPWTGEYAMEDRCPRTATAGGGYGFGVTWLPGDSLLILQCRTGFSLLNWDDQSLIADLTDVATLNDTVNADQTRVLLRHWASARAPSAQVFDLTTGDELSAWPTTPPLGRLGWVHEMVPTRGYW